MSLLKSPWVLHFSCTSCNGCDIEVLASLTPLYDIERFGILNKGNPKFADVLLVTGAVNPRSERALKNLYEQMPEPKAVIVIGSCGATGGVFHDCYNIRGGVDTAIPVDVYVPGCPARPEAIIDGVVKALGLVKEKLAAAASGAASAPPAPPEKGDDEGEAPAGAVHKEKASAGAIDKAATEKAPPAKSEGGEAR